MKVIRAHEGTVLKVLGDRVVLKVRSAESPFLLSIVSVEVPPGSGTPCVSHTREEEVYFVLEGELQMYTASARHDVRRGDLVHLPPGTPHGYRNVSDRPAHFLAWTVGGPMDVFFERVSKGVHVLPQDLPELQSLMAEFGVARAI